MERRSRSSLTMLAFLAFCWKDVCAFSNAPPPRSFRARPSMRPLLIRFFLSASSSDYTESDSGLCLPTNAQKEDCISLPENPISKSGVPYSKVLNGLDQIFPPEGLDQRTALSRKDGYWPFIHRGEEVPNEFVYGEFDVYFFAQVLDRAQVLVFGEEHLSQTAWNDKIFCDLGSGAGRLVLAAAALHKWKLCRGVELLQSLHISAEENLEKCRQQLMEESKAFRGLPNVTTSTEKEIPRKAESSEGNLKWQDIHWSQYKNSIPNDAWLNQLSDSFGTGLLEEEENDDDHKTGESFDDADLPHKDIESDEKIQDTYVLPPSSDEEEGLKLAPVEFSSGSFDDPYEYFGDADCVFVFSTAMPKHVIDMISRAVGRQCKPGCIVITTEYQLPLEGVIEPSEDDPSMPSGRYKLELVEELTGNCWCTGGTSTAFFHRVSESLWEGGVKRTRPAIFQ
jgi:hypothetical protein